MKAKIKTLTEFDIKTFEIKAAVRYWEDATINGVQDEEGALTPLRDGDLWCPIIDVDTGIIKDWPKGTTAEIHFKVCDAGSYFLKDKNGIVVASIEDNYVPEMACPKENGYGDYIIMDIDENGKITDFEFSMEGFNKEEN